MLIFTTFGEFTHFALYADVEKDNPCSMSSRRQVLSKVDLESFPNFYRNVRSLPEVMEGDALFIGNRDQQCQLLKQMFGFHVIGAC